MNLPEYTVKAASNLTFKQWEDLVDALKALGVSTVSKTTNLCPNCGSAAPTMWHIYVREEDRDLVAE